MQVGRAQTPLCVEAGLCHVAWGAGGGRLASRRQREILPDANKGGNDDAQEEQTAKEGHNAD